MRRIEKDPEGGWIARKANGRIIGGKHWRWSSREVARTECRVADMLDRAAKIPPSPHTAAIRRRLGY